MSKNKGVLFFREENGEPKWFENGDEDNDGKYLGIIENGKPNGQGTYTLSDGGTFEGYLNGFGNGNGKHTDSEGKVYEGEFLLFEAAGGPTPNLEIVKLLLVAGKLSITF